MNKVLGVVLGYNAGIGILLLQHRTSPTIEATVKSYLDNPQGRKHWLAKFKWSAVTKDDRELIRQRQEALLLEASRRVTDEILPRKRGRKQDRRAVKTASTVGDYLIGKVVTCSVAKNPKWEAVEVQICFDHLGFTIPEQQQRKPIVSAASSDPPNPAAERMKLGKPGSMRRPWGGMRQ